MITTDLNFQILQSITNYKSFNFFSKKKKKNYDSFHFIVIKTAG